MKLEFQGSRATLPDSGGEGGRPKDVKVDLAQGRAGIVQLGLSLQGKLREVLGDRNAQLVTLEPEEQTSDRVVVPIETSASPEIVRRVLDDLHLNAVQILKGYSSLTLSI